MDTDWVAAIIAIAALIVGCAGLPSSRYRPAVLFVAGTLVFMAIFVGIKGKSIFPSPNPSMTPSLTPGSTLNSTPGSTPTFTSTPSPRSRDYVQVSLETDSSIPATLYFGSLEAVISALEERVVFATDEAFRQENRDLCVSTVLFTNVPQDTGEVYAEVGEGWGAAEDPPNNRVDGTERVLHQQLIVPPKSAEQGNSWTGRAILNQGSKVITRSADYTLAITSESGTSQEWDVASSGTVTCGAS
jgi:hypothetical protein